VELGILLDAVAFAEDLTSSIRPATANERRLAAALRQIVAGAEGVRRLLDSEDEDDDATTLVAEPPGIE